VIDNYRIHKSIRVQEICDRHHVLLKFLPLYCPFFNPIEESFNNLKVYIRRHYYVRDGIYNNFEEFLVNAIRGIDRGEDAAYRARTHFRHTRYLGVPNEIE
jgi:transposase